MHRAVEAPSHRRANIAAADNEHFSAIDKDARLSGADSARIEHAAEMPTLRRRYRRREALKATARVSHEHCRHTQKYAI